MSLLLTRTDGGRRSLSLTPAVVASLAAAVGFCLHFRFVLVHFSGDGYLLDSGWFAHLLASADPWLRNPGSINDSSFYNYHISPFLFLFGTPLRWVGLERFAIFALHQGVMFAALTAALISIVSAGRPLRWVLLGAIAATILFGNMVWQIAGYPHIEIATLALCTAGFAFQYRGRVVLAAIAYGLALLVREDGGLFAGMFLIATAALRMRSAMDWRTFVASRELLFATIAIAFSVLMFWIKAAYFPAFPMFTVNFSGEGWGHVTLDFVTERFMRLSGNLPILLTVLAVGALSLLSWRYLIIPVLVSPLLLAQFLSVRDVIGLFELHYIIPWLAIWIGFVLVAACRTNTGEFARAEAGILLAFAILSSAPAMAALQQPSSMTTLRKSVTGEVAGLVALAEKLEQDILQNDRHGVCLSIGAVAIVPDAVFPHQVIGHDGDLSRCTRIYALRGDMDYRRIKQNLDQASYQLVHEINGRIEIYQLHR